MYIMIFIYSFVNILYSFVCMKLHYHIDGRSRCFVHKIRFFRVVQWLGKIITQSDEVLIKAEFCITQNKKYLSIV